MTVIILCSHNGEEFIEEQLRSILMQEGSEERFRILVSDDCSEDRTVRIVENLQEEFPGQLKLLRREQPSGGAGQHFLAVLREGAWREQPGEPEVEYLMFADQDDLWHHNKLAKSLAQLRAVEAVYQRETPVLVHCDAVITNEYMDKLSDSFAAYQQMSMKRCAFHQLLVQNNVTGGAMMFNRALAELAAAPRPGELPKAVMHDQWLALAAAAFGQIRFIDEALYYYRQHSANVLGARRGGMMREVLARLGLGGDGRDKAAMDAHSRAVYAALFAQAESFRHFYGDRLDADKLRRLDAFISLPRRGRAGKILTILRYGLTYNRLHRTLGECFFI